MTDLIARLREWSSDLLMGEGDTALARVLDEAAGYIEAEPSRIRAAVEGETRHLVEALGIACGRGCSHCADSIRQARAGWSTAIRARTP